MGTNIQITNNASGSLLAGISDVSASLQLQVGEGAEFPATTGSNYFYATIANVSGDIEIVKVTARSGDIFSTIVRSQDNTSAQAWVSSDIVSCRPIAVIFEDIIDELQAGTPATSFQIDNDNTGPRIKNNIGALEFKNEADDAYANLYAYDLYAYDTTNDFIHLDASESIIEMCDSAGNAGIDFKKLAVDDYDCRIIQVSNGLEISTGGEGAAAVALTLNSSQVATFAGDLQTEAELVIDSDNTGPRLRNVSGVLEVRNYGDSDYAVIRGSDLYAYDTTNDFIHLDASSAIIEMCDSAGNAGIDFKKLAVDDYDCRIIQVSNGLEISTGGEGAAAVALTLNSSLNATFAGTINAVAITSTGALVGTSLDAGSGTIETTGTTTTGDHGTAATDEVVNVCYGTGSPPAANTTTIGSIFIKYAA